MGAPAPCHIALQEEIGVKIGRGLGRQTRTKTIDKVGGYEVLFRDGVPLNENFLALKTKYKNERDQFEKMILDLNTNIDNTKKENENLNNQIEQTNKN